MTLNLTEKHDRDQHSTLFCPNINDEEKYLNELSTTNLVTLGRPRVSLVSLALALALSSSAVDLPEVVVVVVVVVGQEPQLPLVELHCGQRR